MGIENSTGRVERFPGEEVLKKNLKRAVISAADFLARHEPEVEKQRRAFVELAERIREAEEVWEVLQNAKKVGADIEEEIDLLVKGARQTYRALIAALENAKKETGE